MLNMLTTQIVNHHIWPPHLLTDIDAIYSPSDSGLLISQDTSYTTLPTNHLRLRSGDIVFDGHDEGFDFWVEKGVNHCYFGMDLGFSAPLATTLAYFGRQNGGMGNIVSACWGDGASVANQLQFHRYRGSSSSPSAVQSGDQLGTVAFAGATGAGSPSMSAKIWAVATENFTSSNRGTKLIVSTVLTGSGAGSISDRLWFEGNGQAVFGNQVLLSAGGTGAGTAPLKLQSGSLNSTPENGALEYDGTHLYFTIGSTRIQLA